MQSPNQKKKSVFISGSRNCPNIPALVQESLKKIVDQKILIRIGDSEQGVDYAICNLLRADSYYPYVEIYTIKSVPRIPIEAGWTVHHVIPNSNMQGQEAQMAKDRQMAWAADWGLAVFMPTTINWRGQLVVSAGTLRNVIQMLLQQKQVKLFYWYEGECRSANLKVLKDLEKILENYKNEYLFEDLNFQIRKCRGFQPEKTPVEFRYEKIMEKYQALLKKETKLMEKFQNSIEDQSATQFQQKLLFG